VHQPTLFITTGDPAGVGPEVSVKAVALLAGSVPARLVLVGNRFILERATQWTGIRLRFVDYQADEASRQPEGAAALLDLQVPEESSCVPGRLDPACGAAAYAYLAEAVQRCLAGEGAGVVTAPLNKAALNAAGYHFAGHTEALASLCGVRDVAMLLVSPSLRVSHVSTHCSLAEAISRVRSERIETVTKLTAQALTDMGVRQPRLAIAGLNPHAGEGGLFGDEEERHIRPAVTRLQQAGYDVTGPEPPDSVFLRAVRGAFDAVVAMYHDQGHIPVKLLGFNEGVNVTLGLPIVRTSVDHGTAFDIAGTGTADPGSMVAAIRLAAQMAGSRAVND